MFPDHHFRWNIFKIWLFIETNVSYLSKKIFEISFSKTKNIKKREFFCQNLKSQKSVLLNNLVIRGLNFVINANILGIAKRPHMEDYEFSKFQQKFSKFKSKFEHRKKKVPICFVKFEKTWWSWWLFQKKSKIQKPKLSATERKVLNLTISNTHRKKTGFEKT